MRTVVAVVCLFALPALASAQDDEIDPGALTAPRPAEAGSLMLDPPSSPPPAYGSPVGTIPPFAPTPTACPPELVCQAGPDHLVHTYRPVLRRHVDEGLLGGGIALFVGGYGLGIVGSLLGLLVLAGDRDAQPDGYLGFAFVPLAGPIGQMFFVGRSQWQFAILAAVELVEIAGLVMAVVGQIGGEEAELEMIGRLRVVPWASEDGAGALATGRF